MNISDILENEIPAKNRVQMDNVHRLECEEVLDNLGYIKLNRNDENYIPDLEEIKSKIRVFRQEYKQCFKIFNVYDNFSGLKDNLLTEEEIEFMQELSSLEDEFPLHYYSLEEIGANKLLSRALTYRLNILSVFPVTINYQLPDDIDTHIDQLKIWCNTDSTTEILSFLGDIDKLSEIIAESNDKSDSISHYFAFFHQQKKKYKMPDLPQGTNWEFFKQNFTFIDKKYTDQLVELKKNRTGIDTFLVDTLNQLQLRLIQIRLWLLGTYEGALDNDMGPLTVRAIEDALDYAIDNEDSTTDDFLLRNLLFKIDNNTLVINVNFLFKKVFPIFLDKDNSTDEKTETFSEKIMQVVDQLEKQDDKNAIYSEIQRHMNNTSDEVTKRKVKTRSSKGFLRSLRKFFKRVVNFIKEGIKKVIAFLNKLFLRIKNGVRILVREFKKIINMIKTALTFFFSSRIVKTDKTGNVLLTNYDLNFDSSTKITNGNGELILEHINKIKYISQSMAETSEFLGFMVNILLKVVKGPFGWIQIALDAIKYLSDTKFAYNRLSFRTFE